MTFSDPSRKSTARQDAVPTTTHPPDTMDTKQIALETLARLNAALASDANALVSTRSGDVSPEAAYVELVREILALAA